MSADDYLSTSSFESTDSGGRLKKKRNKVTFSDRTDTRTYVPAAPLLDDSDAVPTNVDLVTPAVERSAVLLATTATTAQFFSNASSSPPSKDCSSANAREYSRSPRAFRPVPPPPAEENPVRPNVDPSISPLSSTSADGRSIARDACIVNDYVRLREVLYAIEAERLKSALLRRLEEGNARLVVALSLLLPRQSYPSRSKHCVKCHENYEDLATATAVEAGRVGGPDRYLAAEEKPLQSIATWNDAGGRNYRRVDRPAEGGSSVSTPHFIAACEHASSAEAALQVSGHQRSCLEAGCLKHFV